MVRRQHSSKRRLALFLRLGVLETCILIASTAAFGSAPQVSLPQTMQPLVAPGGGNGTPTPDGLWNVKYTYAGTTTVQQGSNPPSSASWPVTGGGFVAGPSSVTSNGSITATLTWLGQGAGPATVNVIVSASSAAQAGPSVNDGYNDPTTTSGGWTVQAGQHVKTLSTESNASGKAYAEVSCGFATGSTASVGQVAGATVSFTVVDDPRYASIQLAGHPVNYFKQPTGNTKTLSVTTADGVVHNYTYGECVPAVNSSIISPPGNLTQSGTLYIGLPEREQDITTKMVNIVGDTWVAETFWNQVPDDIVSFLANVLQKDIPTEHYDWTSSSYDPSTELGSLSSDLPVAGSWVIQNFGYHFADPITQNKYDTTVLPNIQSSSEIQGDAGTSSDFVALHYRWNDGVVADCRLTIQVHKGAEPDQQVAKVMDIDQTQDWQTAPMNWTAAGTNCTLKVTPGIDTVKVATGACVLTLGVLSALDPPVGIAWSFAAAAFSIAIAQPIFTPTDFTINAPGQADINNAAAYLINNNGVTVNTPYPVQLYQWEAQWQPWVQTIYSTVDNWTLSGYVGQSIGTDQRCTNITNSPLQYMFKYVGPN